MFMYVLNQGPLWDVNKLFNEANAGRKTEKTEAQVRESMDSGVSILTYDKDGQVTREALTHKYLLRKRAENDEREASFVPNVEKAMAKSSGSNGDVSIDVTKAVLNEAIATAKRPSELNSTDIASITKEDLAQFIKYKTGAKGLGETDSFRLGVFSDVHYGSDCDVPLLEAAVKDAMNKKINLLVMDGDMIEGALGYFKRELRENKRPEIADAYKKFLEGKGLSEATISKEMNKFYNTYINNLSRNTEEQAYGLIKRMIPVIQDVIGRGGSIIVVSGNHYNKTGRDNENDEAERLASVIKPFFMGMEAAKPGSVPKDWESHIKVIHGGETGAGEMSIGKTNIFAAHKPVNVERQDNHADILVVGHEHDYEERQVGSSFILKMFHMQKSESSYVQTFGVPIGKGLNGWGYFDIERDDKGKVIKVESHPVLRQTLINRGMLEDNPLYNEFWEQYNNVPLASDKKKSKSS